MDAKITRIDDVNGRDGGKAFRICLSSVNENPPHSYKSYVSVNCNNYMRWAGVIRAFKQAEPGKCEIILKGLNVFKHGYADADSEFFMMKRTMIQEGAKG